MSKEKFLELLQKDRSISADDAKKMLSGETAVRSSLFRSSEILMYPPNSCRLLPSRLLRHLPHQNLRPLLDRRGKYCETIICSVLA